MGEKLAESTGGMPALLVPLASGAEAQVIGLAACAVAAVGIGPGIYEYTRKK